MTNFERIKAMSVEEMAKFLQDVNLVYGDCMVGLEECKHSDDNNCAICFKEWLETEVENNGKY